MLLLTLNVVAQTCAVSIVTNTSGTHKPTPVEVYDISGEPLNPKTITCLFENNGGNGKPMYCDVTKYNPLPAYYLYKTCTGQSDNCKLCLYNAQGELVEGGVLSLELLEFNVQKDPTGNNITWTTQYEKDIDYFIIQRLEQDHWIDIRRVKAVNQDERNTYSILDFDYPLNQENYYQLVEITFDGNKTDLGIATVDNRINNKNIVAIYDTLGNVVNENYTGLVIILYEDGSTTKAYR